MDVTLKDVVFDAGTVTSRIEHYDGQVDTPETTCCSSRSITSLAAASSSGKAINRRGREPAKYPFATMTELRQHAEQNNLSIADVILANEMAIPGKTQDEVYAFIDKITGAMVAIGEVWSECAGRRLARTDQAAIQGR